MAAIDIKNAKSKFSVDRHKNLSKKDFMNEYVKKEKPVILTEAAREWEAFRKWTPEFFKSKYGHIEREVNGKNYKIGDYIDIMFSATPDNPAPYPYNFNVQHYFPELLQDIYPKLLYGKIDRLDHPLMPYEIISRTHVHEIFFGGCGSFFPLHYDEMFLHTSITQIHGDKEFFLFAPDQTPYLYAEEENNKLSKIKNIFNFDEARFPDFKKAEVIIEMVHAGETIFFPTRWWHTTRMPGPSITYGRAQLNATNWKPFLNDYKAYWSKKKPLKSSILYSYGKALGALMNLQEAVS